MPERWQPRQSAPGLRSDCGPEGLCAREQLSAGSPAWREIGCALVEQEEAVACDDRVAEIGLRVVQKQTAKMKAAEPWFGRLTKLPRKVPREIRS